MAVPSCMPHEILGYDKDDVYGTLLSISIISEVSKKQEQAMHKTSNSAKQNSRRDRMKRKNPGYV